LILQASNLILEAILNLVECGQVIFKDTQSPEEWLRSTWLDIPILPTIIPLLKQDSLADTEAIEYYQRYRQSASVLLDKIEQLLNTHNVVDLISSHNHKDEVKILFSAANLLEGGELDKAIELINSNLEKRIRSVFHLFFPLRFGPDYLKYIPESAQKRIAELESKGPIPIKRTMGKNLFYHLSRSEYAEVVNSKSNWAILFEKMFSPWQREEVVKALQLTFALDDRQQHRDRIDFFRQRKGSIQQAIVNADWLYESLGKAIKLAIKPQGFESKLLNDIRMVRVSFANQGDAAVAFPWKLQSDRGKDIARRVMRMTRTLNALDDNSVSSMFNCEYGVFHCFSPVAKTEFD
jgi:hypothetical protein